MIVTRNSEHAEKIIYPSIVLVSIWHRLSKYYSWRKCSKHTLNFLSQNRICVRKKVYECRTYWKLCFCSNLGKAQPGEKLLEPNQHKKALHHKQTLNESQRIQTGEKLYEFSVWKSVYPESKSCCTSKNSYRRETLWMLWMWKKAFSQPEVNPYCIPDNPNRGEALGVQPMWENLYPEVTSD